MHWSFFETFVQTGCLTVIAPDGRQRHFGQGNPAAAIEFSDAGCLSAILRNPEMNLGRTYDEDAGGLQHSPISILCFTF